MPSHARTNRRPHLLPFPMAVLVLLAAPCMASAQARASIGVAARIAPSSSVRSVEAPRQIDVTTSGSAYAGRLTLAGPARVNVSVAMEGGEPGGAVRVRDAAGRLRPLVVNGGAVVVVDRVPTEGSGPVDVEYRVAPGSRQASAKPVTLTYTVVYPGV